MIIDREAEAALSGRDVGQIPVSIGTSLALEGAFGILEDNHNPKPIIHSVDVMYVNLRTLIRNMVGSIDPEQLSKVFPEDMAFMLTNELTTIREAVALVSKGRVKVQYYLCNYRTLPKRYPAARLKNANTDKQKFDAMREENTVMELKRILDHHPEVGLIESDIDLPNDNRRVLLLSSYAVDLLQRYRFQSVMLLESHTGAVKPPSMWHTKLTNGKELSCMPFDRMTIQFFGDNNNLFSGYPIKARRVLIDIAIKNRWNALTTKDYILSCVKKAYEPELELLMHRLYSKS